MASRLPGETAIEEFSFEARDNTHALLETSVFAGTVREIDLWGYSFLELIPGAESVEATVTSYIRKYGPDAPIGLIFKRNYLR